MESMSAPELENQTLLELQGRASEAPPTQGGTFPTGFTIQGQPGPVFTFASSSGFGFAGAGNTITLSVTNATTARTALGIDPAATLKSNLSAAAAPTVNDDSGDGYAPGSLWLDLTADEAYICLDSTLGAAVWKQIT
jgi:hypothetical protein